jgi:5-methylcytosine-specific restriction endonuclease McrA
MSRRTRRSLRAFIWERDRGVCQLCGSQIRHMGLMTLDHVYPKSKGGRSNRQNLQAAHRLCNVRRGNRDLILASPLTTEQRIALQKRDEP